jgi:hypothetical protein
MKRFTKPVVILLVVVLTGCGYHFVKVSGNMPPDVKKVYIPPFDNKTGEPDIGFIVASSLSKQFIKSGMLLPSKKMDADAEIVGVVKKVTYRSRIYDNKDLATLVRVGIIVDIELKRIGGGTVWKKKNLNYHEDYSVAGGGAVLDTNKSTALEALADELALDVHDRILLGQ